MKFAISLVVAFFAVVQCQGSTIISVTQPDLGSAAVASDSFMAVGWTQTGTYYGVSVRAWLNDYSGTDVTAYLTISIGPGTSASDIVASRTFIAPGNATGPGTFDGFTNFEVFSGLSLGPGNYFLVLAGSVPCCSIFETDWLTGSSVMTDSGVSVYSTGLFANGALGTILNTALPPASTFGQFLNPDQRLMFSATSIPEPSSMLLLGSGLLSGLGILRRKMTL